MAPAKDQGMKSKWTNSERLTVYSILKLSFLGCPVRLWHALALPEDQWELLSGFFRSCFLCYFSVFKIFSKSGFSKDSWTSVLDPTSGKRRDEYWKSNVLREKQIRLGKICSLWLLYALIPHFTFLINKKTPKNQKQAQTKQKKLTYKSPFGGPKGGMCGCAQKRNQAVLFSFGEKDVTCPQEILFRGSFEIINLEA